MKLWTLLYTLILSATLPLHAQSLIPPYSVSSCIACHGKDGVGTAPNFPNLGGQHAEYLFKQMANMQQGKNRNPSVMGAIFSKLSTADLRALAYYYSNLPISIGSAPKKAVKLGAKLYQRGSLNKQITACIACHGPGGEGNAEANFPLLSGQQKTYVEQQLRDFKQKKRINDYNKIMQDIAHNLAEEDIKTLAAYIEGLYPTAPIASSHCCVKR
ncbi:MAG: hypothetical protein A3F18_05960 [Legionellales bacterium RIFCSPHIGHO2_12_FULL_37_14]|nr:MAG: hypothetical protein A3F18_05960 [Legionellales bacterium RIFCSPHIGHO2_12_FULL_37_14]